MPVQDGGGLKGGRDSNESRGTYKPLRAGEYRVVATAKGTSKDDKGKTIEVTGDRPAQPIVYQDDAETAEKAANPDFLKELAAAGGGQNYRRTSWKSSFRNCRRSRCRSRRRSRRSTPTWRTKGRSPFLLAFFLLFVQVLALEWFLPPLGDGVGALVLRGCVPEWPERASHS